ncbi:AMP-binding protein [Pseudonocardia sp. GCM10023141]|uniref:AMP-binding protein n=1 Tax=Pseudonocardia sp. GCM10023141 TaxID=3252653 RepID=UPI00361C5B5E
MDVHAAPVTLDPDLAARYREQGWWRDRTLIDDFREHAERTPDRVAIVTHRAGQGRERITYGRLSELVDRFAAALLELGVRPGDVVSFQLPNWWQFTALHLACARIEAVTNAILPILRHREVQFICERLGSRVCVVPARFRGHDHAAMLSEVAAATGLERVFVIDAEPDAPLPPGTERFEPFFVDQPWERKHSAALDRLSPHPDSVAQIQFTSGTTGEPKGVVHTWNTVYAGTRIVPDTMGLTTDDTLLAVSPMAHTVGFYFGVTMPMSCGMTVVYQDVWEPRTMIELVREYGVAWTMVAPTLLADLLAAAQDEAGDDPRPWTLRNISVAGAPIPPAFVRRARERFDARVHAVWGMTECGAFTTTRREDDALAAADSDGTPMPWNEVRVAAADGDEVPVGGVGRLLVRGAALFTSYHGRPDLYAAALDPDGWFDTGDLARRDAGGGIRLAGRVKDLVIRGGENIPVVEVEATLLTHPLVREVAVVGVPDERLGERACAVVVPSDPAAPPVLATLVAHLRQAGMARHFWPELLVLHDDLPRTTTGKIQKFRLRNDPAVLGAVRDAVRDPASLEVTR